MSNRLFRSSAVYSMEKDVKQLFAKVSFGSTGAPTLDTLNSKGIASITRISAGLYEVTMGTPASTQAATADIYKKTLMVKHTFQNATAPASPGMFIPSNTVTTTGKMRLQFNAAGTATDPASGEVVYLQLIFGDSNT